ncbi:helix-turn-helix domain-containing protein [Amycolatopsis sp. cmx-4-54]|uniref:helix-turn-helix domain-containing protein n=1 Tax=Amycolatopsis sp. cmx-4-54 TaxID=2790936 RepID=UPI00397DDFAA
MTDDLGVTLKREYEDGATVRDLMAKHHLTRHRVQTLLLEAGTTLRNVGPAKAAATPKMVAAYENGATIVEVGKPYGLSYGVTRRLLLEAGVELRGRGGRPAGTRITRDDRTSNT